METFCKKEHLLLQVELFALQLMNQRHTVPICDLFECNYNFYWNVSPLSCYSSTFCKLFFISIDVASHYFVHYSSCPIPTRVTTSPHQSCEQLSIALKYTMGRRRLIFQYVSSLRHQRLLIRSWVMTVICFRK